MAGGFAMSGPVAESTLDVWNRQIAINLTTAFLTTRAVPADGARRTRARSCSSRPQAALPGCHGSEHVGVRRREERRRRADARHRRGRTRQRSSRERTRADLDSHRDERSRRWATTRSTSSASRSPTSSLFSARARRARSRAQLMSALVMTLAGEAPRSSANGAARSLARGVSALSAERHVRRAGDLVSHRRRRTLARARRARATACPARSTRTSTSS